MSEINDQDAALVRAFAEGYQEAGGRWLGDEEEVLIILREHGARTARQAEVIGAGEARRDLDADDGA